MFTFFPDIISQMGRRGWSEDPVCSLNSSFTSQYVLPFQDLSLIIDKQGSFAHCRVQYESCILEKIFNQLLCLWLNY